MINILLYAIYYEPNIYEHLFHDFPNKIGQACEDPRELHNYEYDIIILFSNIPNNSTVPINGYIEFFTHTCAANENIVLGVPYDAYVIRFMINIHSLHTVNSKLIMESLMIYIYDNPQVFESCGIDTIVDLCTDALKIINWQKDKYILSVNELMKRYDGSLSEYLID
jgi:hypothetical protein